MKLKLSGSETIDVSSEFLWNAIIDPKILKECIPGCLEMKELNDGEYNIVLNLKVGGISPPPPLFVKLQFFYKVFEI